MGQRLDVEADLPGRPLGVGKQRDGRVTPDLHAAGPADRILAAKQFDHGSADDRGLGREAVGRTPPRREVPVVHGSRPG